MRPDLRGTLGSIVTAAALALISACGDTTDPPRVTGPDPSVPPPSSAASVLPITGRGTITSRYTAEVWAHGDHAYTSTWGGRGNPVVNGNAVFVWNVRGTPQLVDSIIVPPLQEGVSVRTTGDVQVSDDGALLVFPTELAPGSLELYSLANPARPTRIGRFTSPNITRGVHTAELQRINGRLYAFLSINLAAFHPSRLMIVDLGDPSAPREVMFRDMGSPFIHDVFVRDGLLFTALWDAGVVIWDIGGGGKGGSLENPVEVGRVLTRNGKAHNVWWFHEGATGARRFVFVGEEGPATLFTSSSGDIHVVDMTNPAQPVEVAFFNVPGAGTHNFVVDEARGLLYAAFYNGGVQVLDVSGDLSRCTELQKSPDGRCDLRLMGRLVATGVAGDGTPAFVWGVHLSGGVLYASDMLNGLVRMTALSR